MKRDTNQCKIVRRYKSEAKRDYTIRKNRRGQFFIFLGNSKLSNECDSINDAAWQLRAMTT